MYVNQIELQEWMRQQRISRHRYEDIDGDDDRFSSKQSLPGSASARHIRNPSILSDDRLSSATFQSQNSLNSSFLKSPRRGATVHDDSRPSSSATIRKRPIPTPRTILNTSQGSGSDFGARNRRHSVGSAGRIYSPLDRLILKSGELCLKRSHGS